ncbi:hypothetical protein DYE49_07230 [Treponema rectale]|uniref:Lipoprotein n=1 Tax=Treponema rectale TaxID=744512 RepID=A0A840SCW8_9SPIR|nr:hypothetical protein [Treponema rectale]MBB5218028.1 hypothetical protein [Treponema rectale]QOS40257.1 hypothetical protein DYE49_07230 [Treponema rectale]
MKNALRAFGRAFLSALALSLVFGFVSCKTDDDSEIENVYVYVTPLQSDSLLYGVKWADSVKKWNTYSTYDAYCCADYIQTSSYGMQESTVYQRKISDTEGFLYYKITNTSNFTYSDKDASSYLGKWYGVYYKNLTSSSVTMCDAYYAADSSDYYCFDSLEEAVNGFTPDSGYFTYLTDFTKVTE